MELPRRLIALFRQADPTPEPPWLDAQLNVYNVERMLARAAERYDFVRFDPNNDCNVRCVYCHNHRSAQTVEQADLEAFLAGILAVRNFQVGCVMEPTLDARLADLLLAVRRCRVGSTAELILQTNGILLHRHDPAKLRDARLTRLSVSIDAADPTVHRALRGGTSLDKVSRNLRAFRDQHPSVALHFITTVTRANLDSLEGLIRFGQSLGVSRFVMREVFYHPDNDVVDRTRMPDLVLRPGEYSSATERLRQTFGPDTPFEFADEETLLRAELTMSANSLRPSPHQKT